MSYASGKKELAIVPCGQTARVFGCEKKEDTGNDQKMNRQLLHFSNLFAQISSPKEPMTPQQFTMIDSLLLTHGGEFSFGVFEAGKKWIKTYGTTPDKKQTTQMIATQIIGALDRGDEKQFMELMRKE